MIKTTVVAKTDLAQSTKLIRSITSEELTGLLNDYANLTATIVQKHDGHILKSEGDAFWLTFPSVTTATLAAVELQHQLRLSQINIGETRRLKMRVVIGAGDLLHKDNDLFGATMSNIARIEGFTPADEIYLSHAGWLLLNHAEVDTIFVDEIAIKGFDEPERIYKVISSSSVHNETKFVVITDLANFVNFVRENNAETISHALNYMA